MKAWKIVAGLFIGTLMMTGIQFGGVGGCGGGTSGGGGTDEDFVTVESFDSTGDLTGSGALTADDTDSDGTPDQLTANLSGIIDGTTGDPIDATTLDSSSFEMTEGAALTASGDRIALKIVDSKNQATDGLDCEWIPTGSGTDTPIDIMFILDTTGSMGGKVGNMTNSLESFFDDLAEGGVNVRAGGIVYGDAFNTKLTTGSAYSVGTGSNEPPLFDTDERPFLDLVTPVFGASDNMDTFLSEIDDTCGFGCGGGDANENTCGAINYAADNTSFRPGALPVFLVFGDNNAHDQETWDAAFGTFDGNETWRPPTEAELAAKAETSGASVFVIANEDTGLGGKPLRELVTGGGTFVQLPEGELDLNTLNLLEFLTAGGQLVCNGTLPCGNSSCVLTILQASTGRSGTWTWNVTFRCD
jgi:hypothetical protein